MEVLENSVPPGHVILPYTEQQELYSHFYPQNPFSLKLYQEAALNRDCTLPQYFLVVIDPIHVLHYFIMSA